ncbi:hypothetical protein STRAU_4746 [Streptomyces aurantiacus JA 4570]|uniref:Uncharacterized protein n=1 Tax=Streptomyces aurantiacus JA 4570 TaxID=1286094 RepID=S3ZEU8_9ACTN|nr:hypothetical protein STRAU_4746 [Streptomyces aurantiacus JA 4570]
MPHGGPAFNGGSVGCPPHRPPPAVPRRGPRPDGPAMPDGQSVMWVGVIEAQAPWDNKTHPHDF